MSKVLLAQAPDYAAGWPRAAPLVAQLAPDYSSIGATATFPAMPLPRVAALLDAQQVSDLTEVVDEKPLYARFMPATHLKLCAASKINWCSLSVLRLLKLLPD